MNQIIEAFALDMRLGNRTPTTIDRRTRMLYQADFELRAKFEYGVDEADTDDLRWWLSRCKWSEATHATYQGHLRSFYRFATAGEDPWLYNDPTVDLPRASHPECVPHPVTDAELAAALERSSDWWRLIITLGAFAGLRAMEILALRREDVTADTIRVRKGKGNKAATIPTHPRVWRIVEPYPSGLLVRDPQPASSSALSARARKHFNSIDLPEVHVHRFRHWYASKLVGKGVDIRTAQTLTRHTNLKSLQGYVLIADDRRRRGVLQLEIGDAA